MIGRDLKPADKEEFMKFLAKTRKPGNGTHYVPYVIKVLKGKKGDQHHGLICSIYNSGDNLYPDLLNDLEGELEKDLKWGDRSRYRVAAFVKHKMSKHVSTFLKKNGGIDCRRSKRRIGDIYKHSISIDVGELKIPVGERNTLVRCVRESLPFVKLPDNGHDEEELTELLQEAHGLRISTRKSGSLRSGRYNPFVGLITIDAKVPLADATVMSLYSSLSGLGAVQGAA